MRGVPPLDKFTISRFWLWWLILGMAASASACAPGHWRPGWNQPRAVGASVPDTAASWKLTGLEKQDGRFVALAISGGGSRAANFGAAVMLELQQRDLLREIDVISGVSGGTLPAVYYVLDGKAGPFTDQAVRKALGYDFQSSWIRRWFLPQNAFRFWFTDFTRSDIMVQVFNTHLYHNATFADLRPHPKLLLNSTVHNDHTRFTFTDDRFADLQSMLASYHVANAVNASSAFPGAFDDVTLENYNPPIHFLHLYDGGPIDNLGVQAILEYLNRNVPGTSVRRLFPKGCLILVVDATPADEHPELDFEQSSRRFIDRFINTNALDAMDAMLIESRRSTLTRLEIPPEKQDQEMKGRLPLNDPEHCGCEVRHISLRHLAYVDDIPGDPEFARRVARIKTKFWVSEDEQRDLFTAAGLLVRELEENELLPTAGTKLLCRER